MSDTALKDTVDGAMRAFEEFKAANDSRLKEIEKKGAADPLVAEKLSKIEKAMDGFEAINQKLTLAEAQTKKASDDAAEFKAIVDRIEVRLNRPGAGGGDAAAVKATRNAWGRAVIKAFAQGEPNLNAEERKAIQDVIEEYKVLTITPDTTGGYLAPSEYVAEIMKGVTLISPARSLVRVRPTAARSIMWPKRTGQFSAQRVAESGTRSETTGLTFGQVEIVAPECYALIDISQQNLEDSAFDLESFVREEAQMQFAKLEGNEIVSGSGVNAAEGFLTNSDVSSTNSGSAATVADANGQANGLITLMHAVATDYAVRGTWVMNRQTLGSARKMKDGSNNYIWMPGLANGIPNTILGAPYVEMPDMPNEGANAFPVAFGDFSRAYVLVDRIAMSMLRDPFTQATAGNIRLLFRRRFGGAVVMAEAIRKLKCST